jgi:4-amino-4-deoxy-L-arabinose transferase-like glycosyltransferase
MRLTLLTKKTSILLLGAAYAFFALTPQPRVRLRDLAVSVAVTALVILPLAITMAVAGRALTGGSYLTWQLFRRPSHDWLFYPATIPEAIGPLVLVTTLAGLWLLRREGSWRETLLLSWIAVPVAFFQLWPVKGFPYLLPIAAQLAVLAGRAWRRGGGAAAPAKGVERSAASRYSPRRAWPGAWSSSPGSRSGTQAATATWRAPAACLAGANWASGSTAPSRAGRHSCPRWSTSSSTTATARRTACR